MGKITVSTKVADASYNISNKGVGDWIMAAQWGAYIRKNLTTPLLVHQTYPTIGVSEGGEDPGPQRTWTNDGPAGNTSGSSTYGKSHDKYDNGKGYRETCPAGGGERTLTFLWSHYFGDARLAFALSDGSATQADIVIPRNGNLLDMLETTVTFSGDASDSTFSLTISNENGDGPTAIMFWAAALSAPAAVVVVPPDAPTITNIAIGNASLSVSGTPPTVTGNGPITEYTATATPVTTGVARTGVSATLPVNIVGMTNESDYDVALKAKNSAGYGPNSATVRARPTAINALPTFSGGEIGAFIAVSGTAITPVDVHALFHDTDALTFSASPAGTAWPAGLVINANTGIISGTMNTIADTGGLRVRATDTAGQTSDSNAFNVSVLPVPVAPVFATGKNVYSVGPGRQFATKAALAAFLANKDLVATQASVEVVDYAANEVMDGVHILPANVSKEFNIKMRVDPSAFFFNMASSGKYYYPNAGGKMTFNALSKMVRGLELDGYLLDFHGSGELKFGTNYGPLDTSSMLRCCVARSDSTTLASCITSGEYAHSLDVDQVTLIRTAGAGHMIHFGDTRNSTINGVTAVCTGSATKNGIAFGGGGGGSNTKIQNVNAINCGDEPIYLVTDDSIFIENYKNNRTNQPMNPAKTKMALGLTYIPDLPFVTNAGSDLRPVAGGALSGNGSSIAKGLNDVTRQNHGQSPDIGAYQGVPASPLPGVKNFTATPKGQRVVLHAETNNGPTSVKVTLRPSSTNPRGATLKGPLEMTLNTGVADLDITRDPGSYDTYEVTSTNAGGSVTQFVGTAQRIIPISGNPTAPNPGAVENNSTVTGVVVSPQGATIPSGGNLQLVAVVNGLNNPLQLVNWTKVSGPGNIGNDGKVTRTSGITVDTPATFRATSQQDSNFSGVATVIFLAETVVVVPPPATTATFQVVDDTSAHSPVTGVVNLDYECFKQARVGSPEAPFKKGTTMAIVNGSATIDISGSNSILVGDTIRIEFGTADGTMGGRALVVVS